MARGPQKAYVYTVCVYVERCGNIAKGNLQMYERH